jgi:hypothetical protein
MSLSSVNGNLVINNGTADLALQTTSTANRIITFPDITCTVVCQNDTATLTNKSFVDSTTNIIDDLDNTKKMQFQVSGITTGTTRTLTVPDASTTIVGTDVAQTLTNKTISGANNVLTASLLKSATTEVSVSSATAPSNGQVLTATSSTTATWQTPTSGGEVNTASNVGVGGVGVFKQKTGVNLEFRNINAGTNKITITNDSANNEIDVDVIEANLTHNNIGGTLDVTKGGTGATTFTSGAILQGNGTSAITATLTAPSGTIVGTSDTQTLTNKSLVDSTTNIIDDLDSTKKMQFQVSGITTGTTRTLTVPDASTTIVGTDVAQTLTNKTLTTPIISTISNTGTLTLPTSTDTLVGRATTDTLTNKTLTAPIISTITNTGTLTLPTITDTIIGRTTTDTLTNKTLTAPVISTITNTGTLSLPTSTDTLIGRATTDTLTNKTLTDSTTTFQDDLDNTKKMRLQLSGLTTATTRTLTVPDASTTLVGIDTAQTLSNKMLMDGTSCSFYDIGNPTNTLYFNINGTGNHQVQIMTQASGSATDVINIPDTSGGTDTFALLAQTQTLTNKSLNNSNVSFVDNTTPTKKISFQSSGATASTTLTIASQQTTSQTLSVPNIAGSDTIAVLATAQTFTNKTLTAPIISTISNTGTLTLPTTTDTIVGRATTDTLTNKSLNNASVFHVDGTDVTKKIGFISSGATTATTLTIADQQTTSQTLSVPNITSADTLTVINTAQTLTNKSLSSNTNNIIARELWVGSGASSVSTYAASAPSTGQVLTATGTATATWQTPSSADIFSGVDTIGGVDISSGWTDIPLDTEFKKTSNITHTASSAEVVINRTGTFQISGYISTIAFSGANTSTEGRLMRDTGGGYAEVVGTRIYSPLDLAGEDDRSTGSFTIVMDVVSGYKFKLQAERAVGTATVKTATCSGLSITTVGAQGAQGPGSFNTPTIAYIASTSNGGVNLSSMAINVPTGTTRDMIMICHMTVRSNTNPTYGYATPPAGWQQISIQTNTDSSTYWRTMYIWIKWSSTSEPSSYTWSSIGPASNYVCGGISTYTNVAAFNIINAEASQATASSLNHDVPAITTTVANTMLIGYVSYASCATSWSLAGGTTQCYTANSAAPPQGVGEGCVSFRKFQTTTATVGGPGAFTATASNDADGGLTDLLALTPAFNAFTPPSIGALDFGLTNTTVLNMGNQNASTNMYNLTTSTGYPTNIPLKVVSANAQSVNIMEVRNSSNTLISGIDSTGRLIVTNSSNGQVQYNNSGIIGGTAQLTIASDGYAIVTDKTGNPPTTPTGGVKLFSRLRSGRSVLAQVGPSGVDFSYQPCLWSNKIAWFTAHGNSVTVTVNGLGNTATGTATTRNCTSTNLFNSMRRVGYVSAATAGSSAGTRHGAQQFWSGNAAGLGGYSFIARFGMSSAATVSGQRSFVGLLATTAALGNLDPSANTTIAMLGFGVDTADSAWTFMHGNGTTVTKDTLTGTFPARDLSVSMFEARIFCKPNDTTIYYSLEVLGGGSLYEGSATTTLPSSTTFLSPQIWTNNSTTALACGIDVVSQYIEADN